MATKKKSPAPKTSKKWKDRGDGAPIIVSGGGGGMVPKKLIEYAYAEFDDRDYPTPALPNEPGKLYFVHAANASIRSLDLSIGGGPPINLMGFLVPNSFLEIHCKRRRERIRITTDPLGVEYHPSDYTKNGSTRREKYGTTIDSIHINDGSDETILKRSNKSATWTVTAKGPITKRRAKR